MMKLIRLALAVAVAVVVIIFARAARAQSWTDSYSRANAQSVRLLLELNSDGGVRASSACMVFSDDAGTMSTWPAYAELTSTSQTAALNALNGPGTRMCINQAPRGALGDAGVP